MWVSNLKQPASAAGAALYNKINYGSAGLTLRFSSFLRGSSDLAYTFKQNNKIETKIIYDSILASGEILF